MRPESQQQQSCAAPGRTNTPADPVAVAGRSEYRIEYDSMDNPRVPADAKWLARSGRAVEN
jgi:fumarate hydratase class II